MERDWARLGRAMASRRKRLGLTQEGLAERIGGSKTAVQSAERGSNRGKPFAGITNTHRAAAQELGWTDRSIDDVLAGGEPTLTEDAGLTDTGSPGLLKGLPLRVVEELTTGEAVDTDILDVTDQGGDHRMVLIFKRDSPEAAEAAKDPVRLRRILAEWSRMQRAIRRIVEETAEPDGPA